MCSSTRRSLQLPPPIVNQLHLVLVLLRESPQGDCQHTARQHDIDQVRGVLVEMPGDALPNGRALFALLDGIEALDGRLGLGNELVQFCAHNGDGD